MTRFWNPAEPATCTDGILGRRRANAYAERWVRTLRQECLDGILIYNLRHLLATLGEYLPALQRTPTAPRPAATPSRLEISPPPLTDLSTARVRRRKVLHGLINEYSQAA